jgi:hypothetical protein
LVAVPGLMARNRTPLMLASVLGSLVAGLAVFALEVPMTPGFMQVIMLIIGMLLIATFSGISRYLDEHSTAPAIRISFNEAQTRRALRDLITAAYRAEVERHLAPRIGLWEPTSESLSSEDPALALAKLRIDLERELRRIAFEQEVPIDPRKTSIRYLLEALAARRILGTEIIAVINDVLPVCNSAIHGGEISLDTASGVLSVGEDLLRILRAVESNISRMRRETEEGA